MRMILTMTMMLWLLLLLMRIQAKKSSSCINVWSESTEYQKGSLQMRRGMRKMKQIFLHYHPRSVTMQPVHTCVRVCFWCYLFYCVVPMLLMLLLLRCVYTFYRYFLLPPQEFRVDMGSMFERCVDVFVYFDTWLSFLPSFGAFFSLALSLSPSRFMWECVSGRSKSSEVHPYVGYIYLFLCRSLLRFQSWWRFLTYFRRIAIGVFDSCFVLFCAFFLLALIHCSL